MTARTRGVTYVGQMSRDSVSQSADVPPAGTAGVGRPRRTEVEGAAQLSGSVVWSMIVTQRGAAAGRSYGQLVHPQKVVYVTRRVLCQGKRALRAIPCVASPARVW